MGYSFPTSRRRRIALRGAWPEPLLKLGLFARLGCMDDAAQRIHNLGRPFECALCLGVLVTGVRAVRGRVYLAACLHRPPPMLRLTVCGEAPYVGCLWPPSDWTPQALVVGVAHVELDTPSVVHHGCNGVHILLWGCWASLSCGGDSCATRLCPENCCASWPRFRTLWPEKNCCGARQRVGIPGRLGWWGGPWGHPDSSVGVRWAACSLCCGRGWLLASVGGGAWTRPVLNTFRELQV